MGWGTVWHRPASLPLLGSCTQSVGRGRVWHRPACLPILVLEQLRHKVGEQSSLVKGRKKVLSKLDRGVFDVVV